MSRIQGVFRRLREEGRKGLIPFVTAGDPEPQATVPLLHALVAGGADLLELGVPFSDPMADGPVIQRSSERALRHRVSLRQVLGMVRDFRREDPQTPVVLMGYLNPIESMGYEVFAESAAASGVDGVLTVDLPPEEAEGLYAALVGQGLDPVFLFAPTTSAERAARIAAAARGFLYYVSLKGVTGADKLDAAQVSERLSAMRRVTNLPIGVGFGVKDAPSAALLARAADAVVVGSALVARLEQVKDGRLVETARGFVGSLRAAIDAASAQP